MHDTPDLMMGKTDLVEKGLPWVVLWGTAASAALAIHCDWPQTLQPASHMECFVVQQYHSFWGHVPWTM